MISLHITALRSSSGVGELNSQGSSTEEARVETVASVTLRTPSSGSVSVFFCCFLLLLRMLVGVWVQTVSHDETGLCGAVGSSTSSLGKCSSGISTSLRSGCSGSTNSYFNFEVKALKPIKAHTIARIQIVSISVQFLG